MSARKTEISAENLALHDAIRSGSIESVLNLDLTNSDLNSVIDDFSPLSLATELRHYAIMILLLKRGVDPNHGIKCDGPLSYVDFPLYHVKGDLDCLRILLHYGADLKLYRERAGQMLELNRRLAMAVAHDQNPELEFHRFCQREPSFERLVGDPRDFLHYLRAWALNRDMKIIDQTNGISTKLAKTWADLGVHPICSGQIYSATRAGLFGELCGLSGLNWPQIRLQNISVPLNVDASEHIGTYLRPKIKFEALTDKASTWVLVQELVLPEGRTVSFELHCGWIAQDGGSLLSAPDVAIGALRILKKLF